MFHTPHWVTQNCSVAIYLYEPSDGGLDRVAILLANHLLMRGVDVELWMTRVDGPVAGLIDPQLTVRRVPAPPLNRRLSMIAQFPALAAMVRRYRPDILYSAGNQSNMLCALAALGTATQAVCRISNPIVRPHQRGLSAWVRRSRFRAIARASAMTIVMGEADRLTLAEAGPLEGRRVTLLPRPTVTPLLQRLRQDREARSEGTPRHFLMVGRLAEQKDQATALLALARLRHLDWRLKIVGQGPLRRDLEALCQRLDIAGRVEFLGFVNDQAELAALMAEADLLLQPSRWEGLVATLIEALGCGTGVVATDSTPNIHPALAAAGQHAPVPVGDADAFAEAILWALEHPVSPARLGEAVREHCVESALDAYLRAFARLVRTDGVQWNGIAQNSLTR
ncbi:MULTISPECIES: glycosyltransferase [unclassified Sphingobium]|uniref:glycosyltransferase n=1 Tax=unclassified Sphingobium TaxID=2611147 RepID=UPI00077054D7|nr:MULTISPECIES: glycosyltransferase [unclassified Sphingobium]AMK23973.1 putative glycosyltransferase [Sphingobium sp. TKS]NML89253.1 glycosyltransferase [Sphingobium sp. TB-6]